MVEPDGPFQIQSCPGYGFYAGHLSATRQALIAKSVYGFITLLEFDLGGTLLKITRTYLPSSLLLPGQLPGCYEVDESEFHEYVKRALGFVPSLIRVREFRVPDEMLAVYRLPEFYRDFLKDPNGTGFDDELRQYLPGQIKRWREEGRFVLEFGNDYWMNSQGEVTDS